MTNQKQYSEYQEVLTTEINKFSRFYKKDNRVTGEVPQEIMVKALPNIERRALIIAINYLFAYAKDNQESNQSDTSPSGPVGRNSQSKTTKTGKAKKTA